MAVTDAIQLETAAYPALVAFDSLWINHEEEGTLTRLSLVSHSSLTRLSLADLGARGALGGGAASEVGRHGRRQVEERGQVHALSLRPCLGERW